MSQCQRNLKIDDQIQNKYKLEDKTKFLKLEMNMKACER